MTGAPDMLYDPQTDRSYKEGDIYAYRGRDHYISGLVRKTGTVYLLRDDDSATPFPIPATSLGLKFITAG